MTTNHDFEQNLGAWLREDAVSRVPGHLDEVLVRTIATRQRPWWSSVRRWVPLDISMPPAPLTRSGSWRPILLVVALVLLIAAVVVVVTGSRRSLPPPFGPARNGVLLSSANGDIFRIDPRTGDRSPVITGSSFDFGPTFARDGTKFAFLRGAPSPCGKPDCGLILVVANTDGSGVMEITPGQPGLDWFDWSPDGRRIAFLSSMSGRSGHLLNIVDVDGTGLTTLDLGRPVNQLSWLPPDGTEILFRGEQLLDRDPPPGIWAVQPDGSGLRAVSTRPALDSNDFNDVAVSPDGTRIAYRDVAFKGGRRFRIRVLDLRTDVDRILPEAPGSAGEGGPGFSPDGRSIVYLRWASDDSTQLVVAPVDGSSFGVTIGPSGPFGPDGPTINNYGFAPDGTAVVANYDAEKVARLMPLDGSPPIVLARGELALATFQRLAP
jgi:Tol biopolymer transport system component